MPKVILNYTVGAVLTPPALVPIGEIVKTLVSQALSTEGKKLTADDVDWMPQYHGIGALMPTVGIEIETIGYPARKAKLTDEVVEQLKADILVIPGFPKIPPTMPLIWVKYVDPDGQHI